MNDTIALAIAFAFSGMALIIIRLALAYTKLQERVYFLEELLEEGITFSVQEFIQEGDKDGSPHK